MQSISVAVTAANDNVPVITSSATASVVENTTAVHQITATDADLPGDSLIFGIAGGNDDLLFNIDGTGNLSFIAAPDFETRLDANNDNIYEVDVSVFDGVSTTVQSINVTVTATNDNAPVITSPTAANVAENTTAVHQVTATDADLPAETLTFSVVGSGADDALFSIDASSNLRFIAAPDFETRLDANNDNVYEVEVSVFDGVTTTLQSILVTVTAANDNAPAINSPATANVIENTTAVHQVTATDSDLPGDTLTFGIAGSGADDALFSIDASGNLRFIAAPDFETRLDANNDNVYKVEVSVFDGVTTTVQSISVTVTAANDNAPVITSPTAANVAENTTAVHQVTATDADLPTETLTFSVVGSGADDALFSIDGSGNLRFIAAPDFEARLDANNDNIYEIDVSVFDGVNTTIQSISVTVTAANDNAPVITSAAAANVVENTTTVHQVTATDADLPGDSLTFGIVGSGVDDALFSIDGSGNLRFIAPPDFETQLDANNDNVYEVEVSVFDGVTTTLQSILVTVTAANDNAPFFTSSSTANVIENTTAVHQLTAADADLPGDTLVFSITGSGNDDAQFAMDASGNLSFINPPTLESPEDADGDNIYEVNVSVSDGVTTTVQSIRVSVKEAIATPPPFNQPFNEPSFPPPANNTLDIEPPTEETSEAVEPASEDVAETSQPSPNAVEPQENNQTTRNINDAADNLEITLRETADNDSNPGLNVKASTLAILQALLNPESADLIRPAFSANTDVDPLDLLAKHDFLRQLDELRSNDESKLNLDNAVVGSTLALSTSLSVGYVAWLARSGALLSSVLTSLPAWQFVDPAPVLAFVKKNADEDDEDDSLESMVKQKDNEDSTRG